jgi:uncharacterized membrane protein YbjE (DUF340 family)
MKASIIAVGFFVAGILAGIYRILPDALYHPSLSEYALYLLMLLVGIVVGGDAKTWSTLRSLNLKILLVPACVIVGSLAGGIVSALVLSGLSLKDGLVVSAGFGYYSLSSILITKYYSSAVGVVALLANMIREIITLLFSPLFARYFGKLAPIASGGAAAMDTTLPIITHSSGKEWAITSVFSGVVLTVLVPFLVVFILNYL